MEHVGCQIGRGLDILHRVVGTSGRNFAVHPDIENKGEHTGEHSSYGKGSQCLVQSANHDPSLTRPVEDNASMCEGLAQIPGQQPKTEHPKESQKAIDTRTESWLQRPLVIENRRDQISDDGRQRDCKKKYKRPWDRVSLDEEEVNEISQDAGHNHGGKKLGQPNEMESDGRILGRWS